MHHVEFSEISAAKIPLRFISALRIYELFDLLNVRYRIFRANASDFQGGKKKLIQNVIF